MAQHLKLHSLTGNSDHDVTGLASGQIIYIQDSTNGVQSTGLYTNGSGGLTATTASITTLSAGTMISGSTNLYNIFSTAGSGVQAVQPGTNTTTGGTIGLPTVNLVASPSVNNITFSGTAVGGNVQAAAVTATSLSAATLSGGTILSGNTNLYSIFATAGSGVQAVQPGSNITTGGTLALPVINLAASPSVNNLTVSGTANVTGALQSGGTNLNNIYVQGSGTSGTIPLWTATRTQGDSIITQNSTGVTVNGSVNIVGNVNVVGTASTFNTQTVQSLDNNITLNYSGSYVTAYGGGITVLSGNANGASSTWTIDANGAWSANTAILTSAITVNGGNINVTGGGQMQSGGTNLYSIFATAGSGVQAVQPGANTTTGGTLNFPTVNVVASPSFNNVTFSGTAIGGTVQAGAGTFTSLSAGTLSAGTINSGSTNLYDIFLTAADVSATTISAGSNIAVSNVGLNYTVATVASPSFNNVTFSGTAIGGNVQAAAVTATSLSAATLSGGTILSGSTNLYSIFAQPSLVVNNVNAGSNITTGGTATSPTINLAASPSVNNITFSGTAIGGNVQAAAVTATSLSAATLSGGTILSGSTNLYSIFAPFGTVSGVETVVAGSNITTGGTIVNPIINLTASPSVNNITFSGTAIGGTVQAGAGTFTSLSAATLSGGTILSGSTNLYSIFAQPSLVVNNVNAGSNIVTGGTAISPTISLAASPSINGLTVSGTGNFTGTLQSGGTNLYSIFATAGSGVQAVQPGSNITTGGTLALPVINLAASPSVNGLTVSGTGNFTGTLQSGGTDLNNIYVQGSGTNGTIPLWTATRTQGNSILTQTGTGVTVNGSVNILGDVNIIGTATTFNTQTVQSQDNNITLNYSGSYVTAYGGGITVLSGNANGSSSTWTIDANGSWSSNTAILTSAITVNGGNINVNGGGQLQSGGTNLYSIFATSGQDLTTASNGLTKTGYNVTLGGTLTAATAVVLGGNALQLSGEGASSTTVAWSGAPYYTRLLVNGSGSQLRTTFGTVGDNYFRASDTITMNFSDGGTGNQMRMAFDGTNMYVTDAVNSRGLEYVNDYSANFLANSLVTKLYVDSAITGVTSGLTNTQVQPGSNITTGGTSALPVVSLVASPSVNNLTVSGSTTAQGISGTTIYASQFFQMTPYTGANPTSPNNNDVWMYSAATGIITLNYRIGGVTKSVELS